MGWWVSNQIRGIYYAKNEVHDVINVASTPPRSEPILTSMAGVRLVTPVELSGINTDQTNTKLMATDA